MIENFQKPIVAIDARMVAPKMHGIARHVVTLAQGLAEVQKNAPLLYQPLFILQSGMEKKISKGLVPRFFSTFQTIEAQAPFLNPRELLEIPSLLKQNKVTLFHSPSFSSLLYSPCPWITTVHDLIHLDYGDIKEKLYYHFLLKRFAKKAEALLTVSKFSQQALASWLNILEEKIDVTYNVLDPLFCQPLSSLELKETLDRFDLTQGNYFFCLSNPKPHKNVSFLVEAYRTYSSQIKSQIPLVLSMDGFSQISGVRTFGSLSAEEARALLSGAGAVFFPSLSEGFGLPPLEASALGTPLVVSDIPPHREALIDLKAGEVHWVLPQDFHGWVNAFHCAARGEIKSTSELSRVLLFDRYAFQRLGRQVHEIYLRVLKKINAGFSGGTVAVP